MNTLRKIIHVDMDAFYASVEQRDNPSLRGKPVIVGGPPGTRSVVSSCSYEARKYGIRSAMSSSMAYRLCPGAIFVRGNYVAYADVSRQIRDIFLDYTDLVEPLSLDEAYLDVTNNRRGVSSATIIAREIRQRIIDETGLTASAGVSYNKFLAKVASDYNKPNGIMIVPPEKAQDFIDDLDIGCFYGIGSVSEKALRSRGICRGRDLRSLDRCTLFSIFGKSGSFYYDIVRGHDPRDVIPHRDRKSVGREITLDCDTLDPEMINATLCECTTDVVRYLRKKDLKGRTITLKIKYHDFSQVTRSITIGEFTDSYGIILDRLNMLVKETSAGRIPVRLVGISIGNLNNNDPDRINGQLHFDFDYNHTPLSLQEVS